MGKEVIDGYPELRRILAERRRSLGMAQHELAALMGTTQSAISELESGHIASPNINTLKGWCTALKVTLSVKLDFEPVQTVRHSSNLILVDGKPNA